MKNVFILVCVVASAAMVSGCAVGVLGAGARAGVAASQEGGVKRAVSDAKLQILINDLWLRYDVKTFAKLDMTINEGRVLITGVVDDPEDRVEAVRLAWQPEGVKQVINEIQIADGNTWVNYATDNWITTRLRSVILVDREIRSINYNIDTVQGVVYLMGVARDQFELDKVTEEARKIPGVKRVVSYVKMSGEAVGSGADAIESEPL